MELKEAGNTLLASGKYEDAIVQYQAALSAACDNETISVLHANVSFALVKLRRHAEAATAAQRAIAARPDWAKAHYRHGSACMELGDRQRLSDAVQSLERAYELTATGKERRDLLRRLEQCAAKGGRFSALLLGNSQRVDDEEDECDEGGEETRGSPPPPRRVEPLESPERIPSHERQRVRAHLQREGYVVVGSCADTHELRELRALMWTHLEESTAFRKGRPETWGYMEAGNGSFPGPAHLGLLTWGHVGQSRLQWRARTLPRVGAAFEAAWGVAPGAPLLVSFDGLAFFRPPQVDKSWRTQRALEWLHVDQGSTKRGLCGLQGALLLWDQTLDSGGFVCIPRSHRRHRRLVPFMREHDFQRFEADDARLDGLGHARQICAKAGDLVLWDSRLVHASQPTDPRSPMPRDDEGLPRPSRAACMISMVPAEEHLVAQPGLKAERVQLIARSCTTTHWPQGGIVASQGPIGSGVGRVERLPSEARALVLGEACDKRAAWGRPAPRDD